MGVVTCRHVRLEVWASMLPHHMAGVVEYLSELMKQLKQRGKLKFSRMLQADQVSAMDIWDAMAVAINQNSFIIRHGHTTAMTWLYIWVLHHLNARQPAQAVERLTRQPGLSGPCCSVEQDADSVCAGWHTPAIELLEGGKCGVNQACLCLLSKWKYDRLQVSSVPAPAGLVILRPRLHYS